METELDHQSITFRAENTQVQGIPEEELLRAMFHASQMGEWDGREWVIAR